MMNSGQTSAARQPSQGVVKVMVVEDDYLARHSLALLLAADDIELVGACATAEEALALAERARPAVALIDMRLAGDDDAGVALIRELRSVCPETVCGVITANDPQGYFYADAFLAGAHGYCRKGGENGDLRALARRLAAGQWVVDSEIAVYHLNNGARQGQWPARVSKAAQLTEREHEVLALVAEQLSSRDIGERLYISEHTVKTHIAHIIAKLQVQNRDQAVLYAVLKGYLNPTS